MHSSSQTNSQIPESRTPDAKPSGEVRRIVVCADDFGMNPAVDGGILLLADMGRLGAASCMSLGASFAVNARALRQAPVDMGLHLDLTEGASGMPLPMLIAWAYAGLLPQSWVDARIHAQLDMFEQICGAPPAYVDGHCHVHQLPGVLPRLLLALAQRYGCARPYLRDTAPPARAGVGWRNAFKARVIHALGGAALQNAAREQGWRCNRRLLGVYGLRGGAAHYETLLRHWFGFAEDADLLMCHPASLPMSSARVDALTMQRAAELQVLSAPALDGMLDARGLRIVRFTQL